MIQLPGKLRFPLDHIATYCLWRHKFTMTGQQLYEVTFDLMTSGDIRKMRLRFCDRLLTWSAVEMLRKSVMSRHRRRVSNQSQCEKLRLFWPGDTMRPGSTTWACFCCAIVVKFYQFGYNSVLLLRVGLIRSLRWLRAMRVLMCCGDLFKFSVAIIRKKISLLKFRTWNNIVNAPWFNPESQFIIALRPVHTSDFLLRFSPSDGCERVD
jgi:hypothetical protein